MIPTTRHTTTTTKHTHVANADTLSSRPPHLLHSASLSTQQGDKRSVDVAPSEAFGDTNPMMGPVDVPRWGKRETGAHARVQ